jgi:hypothetical protein
MGWTYESDTPAHDEWHEGYMLPQFGGGELGRPIGGAGIPPGHIAVERADDGSWLTHPAGAVIGWRIVCDCTLSSYQHTPDRWVSEQLWTRVPSPVQHDPNTFRIYAADADVEDVAWADDVEPIARALWRREHIDERDAAGAISGALNAVRAAEDQLAQAVVRARRTGLSWARIGTAAGMSAQGAHERWAQLARAETD